MWRSRSKSRRWGSFSNIEHVIVITLSSNNPISTPTPLLLFLSLLSQQEQQLNVNDSSYPPVQKRLAAQAHSPRKDISLDDINTKLDQANKRKEENLASATSKTVAHNARVEQVYEQSKEQATHKINALEEHITSKLDNAEAKRDDTKSSWVSVMLLSRQSLQ